MILPRSFTIGTKLAVSLAAVAIQTMSSYQTKIEEVRRASVTALLAARINGNILSAVMESRGIFMSDDPKVLKSFADLLEKTLVQMKDRVARLREMADPDEI